MPSRPIIAAVLVALALACADFRRGAYWDELDDEAGDGTGGLDGDYGYAADVHPLLDAGCERCHAPGNSAGNTDFLIVTDDLAQSYASTLEFVDLDSPSDSRLLTKMAGQNHGAGVVFADDSAEYELTRAWIEQGAPP